MQQGIDLGLRHVMIPFMETHAGEVLKYGVDLGLRTWKTFLGEARLASRTTSTR